MLRREFELPLPDKGIEPVEFLKSMGISLSPLNEILSGDTNGHKVMLTFSLNSL